jgi:hypothetical protein
MIQSFVSGSLFCKISTLKACNFQTVWRKKFKISLKNLKFIRDLVKQIKKYGYLLRSLVKKIGICTVFCYEREGGFENPENRVTYYVDVPLSVDL